MDTVWPVDAVAGSPSYSGRKLRQSFSALLQGATTARPLGARSGVRPGTSTATVTATATTWSCGPFAGIADAEPAAEAGAYNFAFDAATGGALVAQGAFARRDIIYVQVDDPAESDGTSSPAVTRKYLQGTVANTPPATPSRSLVVAWINVPVSGGGAPTVTWVAPYAVAAGGVLPVTDLDALAAVPPYYDGMIADVASCDALFRSNGTAFVQITPARFANDSSRDTEYNKASGAYKVAGASIWRTDKEWLEEWHTAAAVTTAGWFPISGALPYVSLGMSAAQNSVGGGNNTPVAWDLERKDISGWHNPAVNPSRITVTQSGKYRVTRNLQANGATTGQFLSSDFAINGVVVPGSLFAQLATNALLNPYSPLSMVLDYVAAGQYVEVRASTATAVGYVVAGSSFQLEYLGPA